MQAAYDIFEILYEISQANPDLRVTLSEVSRGAGAMGLCTAVGAAIGGLINGREGMIAGASAGFAGGTAYAIATTNDFKPLHKILAEMSPEDEEKLVKAAKRVIRKKAINLTTQIIGRYGSEYAKAFLIETYKEFSGKNVN